MAQTRNLANVPVKSLDVENDEVILATPQGIINKASLADMLDDYAKESEIPTKTSELVNDSGFLTSAVVEGKADKSYVDAELAEKQDILVSAQNIKTINNQSILGSGNIDIQGGSGTDDYTDLVNKPKVNNVELVGNKTPSQLGLAQATHYHVVEDITDFPSLAQVASTGNYNDLSNKPTIPEVDVDKAYVDEEIERVEAEIPSVEGLASEDYVDTAIAGKQDTLTAGANITIENNVISATGGGTGAVQSVNGQTGAVVLDADDVGALPDDTELFSGDYDDLRNKPTIPVVPSVVSAFTNDAGYLTQHQDITGKANISYVDEEIERVEDEIPDVSGLQEKLIAGQNISIAADGKTISATGGGTEYTAGEGIVIENEEISYDPEVVATVDSLDGKEDHFELGRGLWMDEDDDGVRVLNANAHNPDWTSIYLNGNDELMVAFGGGVRQAEPVITPIYQSSHTYEDLSDITEQTSIITVADVSRPQEQEAEEMGWNYSGTGFPETGDDIEFVIAFDFEDKNTGESFPLQLSGRPEQGSLVLDFSDEELFKIVRQVISDTPGVFKIKWWVDEEQGTVPQILADGIISNLTFGFIQYGGEQEYMPIDGRVVPVDNETIILNDDGQLEAVGGGSTYTAGYGISIENGVISVNLDNAEDGSY